MGGRGKEDEPNGLTERKLLMPGKPTPTAPLAGHGHNSLDKVKLKELVDRIESIESERAFLAEDVRGIYQEAKSVGIDVKALRQVVKLRGQDQEKRTALQSTIDEYWSALGDYGTTPLGAAAIARASASAEALLRGLPA
jgi:uncharacterized protein (UPF0335 family)